MPWPTVYLDSEGAIRTWVNGQAWLVGPGRPLALGAHLGPRLRSPVRGCYLLLSRIGGGPDPASDVNVDAARLSGSVYGTKKLATANAAVAYGNLLVSVAAPVPVAGGRLLAVTDVTGPLYLPDGDEERYVVDAVFHIQPN